MSSIDFPSHENIFEITDTFNKIGVIHSLIETIPVEKFNALKLSAWEAWEQAVHTAWDKWSESISDNVNNFYTFVVSSQVSTNYDCENDQYINQTTYRNPLFIGTTYDNSVVYLYTVYHIYYTILYSIYLYFIMLVLLKYCKSLLDTSGSFEKLNPR